MGATAIIEIETEKDRDAQAQFERALAINKVSVKFLSEFCNLICECIVIDSLLSCVGAER